MQRLINNLDEPQYYRLVASEIVLHGYWDNLTNSFAFCFALYFVFLVEFFFSRKWRGNVQLNGYMKSSKNDTWENKVHHVRKSTKYSKAAQSLYTSEMEKCTWPLGSYLLFVKALKPNLRKTVPKRTEFRGYRGPQTTYSVRSGHLKMHGLDMLRKSLMRKHRDLTWTTVLLIPMLMLLMLLTCHHHTNNMHDNI